ncbi:MAG: hypothetical protein WCA89_06875 [Terracidiphilus sp.]|jgi:hypothetical protein
MKIVYALFLIGASLTASGQSELSKPTEAVNPPFKLEITANLDKEHSNVWDFVNSAETTVKTGSMVVVAIRKTNITDHEISKSTGAGTHSSYYIDVHDSDGNLVGLRKPNEVKMIGDDHGGHLAGTKDNVLQPGESMIDHDLVGRWLDMSAPGTYTIQVSAHISNDPKSDVVKSNIITVTVQEPDPPAAAPQ